MNAVKTGRGDFCGVVVLFFFTHTFQDPLCCGVLKRQMIIVITAFGEWKWLLLLAQLYNYFKVVCV